MIRYSIHTAILFCLLVLCQGLSQASAEAAPGDYLFQWGSKYQIDYPFGIARDRNGNIYVTNDSPNAPGRTVQVFNSTGELINEWGDWGSAENEQYLPSAWGVAVDQNSNVYVTFDDSVRVFDSSGKFLRKWGSTGSGDGQFSYPVGLAVSGNGSVYVVDRANHRVQVFDSAGKFLRKWGSQGNASGQFSYPEYVALDQNGDVYVTDAGNSRIQVFDSTGNFLRMWTYTVSNGKWAPDGISVDNGQVYVSDFNDEAVQVFDTSGNLLRKWGGGGTGYGQFSTPRGIVVGGGKVYVADSDNRRIELFNTSGTFLSTWASYGWENGQFHYLNSIATDASGNVYVADTQNYRIQVFSSDGTFLRKWGSRGEGDGQFEFPYAIGTDGAGNVYVLDNYDSRVQVFDAFGTFKRQWGKRPATEGQSQLASMAVDPTGKVYVIDRAVPLVQVFDSLGNPVTEWAVKDMAEPLLIAVDSTGNAYVLDSYWDGSYQLYRWLKYDGAGKFLAEIGAGQLVAPGGLTVDSSGNILVTDFGAYNVAVFDSKGNLRGKWGSLGGGNGQFTYPYQIASDRAGAKIYVGDDFQRIEAFQGFGDRLPPGWSGVDIGSVGIAGGGSYLNGTYSVQGSGANIWSTADAFHYVYKPLTGDGQIVARVTGVQNTNGYAKGGVMIRQSLTPDSPHAMVDIEATAGAEFSRRLTTGGSTTVTGSTGIAAPYWVKLVRQGNTFSGYISKDGNTWTLLGTSTITMASTVYVGLIANSHNNSVLCTTTIDGVSLTGSTNTPTVAITTPAIGATFNAPANVSIAATATPSAGGSVKQVEFFAGSTLIATEKTAPYSFTWNNVAAGSYTLTARVTDTYGGTATSNPVAISVNSSGLPTPWLTQDVGSVGVAGSAGYANGTFTVKGSGGNIYGTSDAFRFVYQPMTGDGQIVARVVSVQNTNTYAKAGVMIRQSLTANSAHAMMDITPTSGAEFSRRTTTGGGTTPTARSGIAAPYWVKLVRSGSTFTGSISSDGVNWSQVGSTTISMSGTVYVGLIVNSHNNSVLCTATFEKVTLSGGGGDVTPPAVTAFTIPSTSSSLTVPITTFTATDDRGVTGYLVTESSANPSATASGWSATPPTSYTFATAGTKMLYAWARDAAGNVSNSRSATVTVTTGALPSPWLTQDIGSVGVIGSASFANGVFTLKGSGADVWGTTDAFRFVYKVLTGDGQIIARIATLQNTNPYAKGGVMIRQSLAANSMHAMMDVTPGNGAEFSRRTSTGGTTTATVRSGVTAPRWVRLVRSGNTFTGSISSDGVNWTQVGSSTINMTSSVYIGFIVNSHSNSVLCTTTIDGVK
jgi:DNA-binding beta-propeller fold protein YncE